MSFGVMNNTPKMHLFQKYVCIRSKTGKVTGVLNRVKLPLYRIKYPCHTVFFNKFSYHHSTVNLQLHFNQLRILKKKKFKGSTVYTEDLQFLEMMHSWAFIA